MKKLNQKEIKSKGKILRILKDESGMGVIEVILIILVLIGLALIFKSEISGIANGIFSSMKKQINTF